MEYTKIYYYKEGKLDKYRTIKSIIEVELRIKREILMHRYFSK